MIVDGSRLWIAADNTSKYTSQVCHSLISALPLLREDHSGDPILEETQEVADKPEAEHC
jgi:hypothetical protein